MELNADFSGLSAHFLFNRIKILCEKINVFKLSFGHV